MFIFVTQKPTVLCSAIIEAIENNTIDTWSYKKLPNSIVRFDWIGGANNWPNLDKRVYFTATAQHPQETDNYLQFELHTKRGHYLEYSDFARMHAELSYMLLAHFPEDNKMCNILPAAMPRHRVDIIDD